MNITDKQRELLEDIAMQRATSDDPITRCIGRLTASNVVEAWGEFFQKEQAAGTKPTEMIAATSWFAATIYLTFADCLPREERPGFLLDMAAKLLAMTLEMTADREAGDGK
ncbi:hypothetical protein [Shinella sp. HZN7]|uniref:hypothetical protein n=1 Tax=Shinella sp. (strain HZN7) TaxID=879274 RepID=UPI0007DA4F9C|nr:hypothetical protein [Shinella sp. HZN7]ANH05177.1 hypothetical protein shn_14820 [Shinella sp. HZN7]